jgi:phosphate-selective porin
LCCAVDVAAQSETETARENTASSVESAPVLETTKPPVLETTKPPVLETTKLDTTPKEAIATNDNGFAATNAPGPSAVSASSVAPSGKSDERLEATKPIWERSPKIKIGGYVHTAFIMNDREGAVDNEFRVRKARVYLDWSQGTLLDGSIEAELSKEVEPDDGPKTLRPLRDAYVRIKPFDLLMLRVGQFKRPFSRIELTGSRTLKLVHRGISSDWISGALGYGARDVGAQVEGRYGKYWGLEYALGVFNGMGANAREIDAQGAKDFVGRVVGHFGKHVEVGVNVANKNWDNPPATVSYATRAWMYGGDIAVDYKGFDGMIEGGYGDNFVSSMDLKKTWYVLSQFSYKIKLLKTWNVAIEPLIKGEMLMVDADNSDSRVIAGTAGANLYLGSLFRLMVQGDFIEPTKESALPQEKFGDAESSKQLTVQVALHTK